MATTSLPSASMESPLSETSSFIYATEYDFLPMGVKKIKQAFGKSLAKENLNAQCNYERAGRSFFVTCAATEYDAIFDLFHKIIGQILEEEVGYDDGYGDEINSKLIARVHFNSDLEEIPRQIEDVIAGGSQSGEVLASWAEWHCQSENQIMDIIIPRAAQEQIEDLTNTKLVENLNLQVIHVESQSKEAGERALHKLDVLQKSFDIAHRTGTHHVFYGEGRENFQVSLKQIIQIPKKLVQTTLLDPFRNQNGIVQWRKVQKICTLRCCYFDPDRSMYLLKAGAQLFPLVLAKDKDVEFEPWKNYTYPGIGEKPLIQVQELPPVGIFDDEIPIHPLDLKERKEKVTKWLADDATPDPVEHTGLLELEEGMVDHDMKNREEKVKKWLADGNSSIPINSEEQIKFDLLDPADPMIDRHLMNNLTPVNTPEILAFKDPREENLNASFNLMDSSPVHYLGYYLRSNENPLQSFQASKASHATSLDNPNSLCNPARPHRSSTSGVIPSSTMDNRNLVRNAIDSMSLDGIPSGALLDIGNIRHIPANVEVTQPENAADNFICHGVPYNVTDMLEQVQINSEVDTREYHNTMWQRAPKRGKDRVPADKSSLNPAAPPFRSESRENVTLKPSDPTLEFTEATNEKIKLLLTSMRIWQGEVLLEAQFGRVILRSLANNVVAWGDSQLSHDLRDMDWILGWHSNTMDFTRILTTVGADAQWIVDLKNASNEPMWKNAPKCSVTYEFECYDNNSSNWFMVEMDAATSETKVKSLPKEIGTVWVHCTTRNWDYRLAAIGSKNLGKEHGHIASEIAKNIYIDPDRKKMAMLFEIDASHRITFNFVRVLRTTLYPSTGNGSQLKITEVHDLKFEKHSNKNIYYAFEAENVMEDGRPTMWYQISLTSPIAERVLEENVSLEFGEETTWSEEDFDERVHIFKSLCLPACYMIKKMDGMGFYNDNGYIAPPAAASSPAAAPTVVSEANQPDDPHIPPSHPSQW